MVKYMFERFVSGICSQSENKKFKKSFFGAQQKNSGENSPPFQNMSNKVEICSQMSLRLLKTPSARIAVAIAARPVGSLSEVAGAAVLLEEEEEELLELEELLFVLEVLLFVLEELLELEELEVLLVEVLLVVVVLPSSSSIIIFCVSDSTYLYL